MNNNSQKNQFKVGDKVKVYSMYTKRMRTRYIVDLKEDGRLGISTCKGCGENQIIYPSEIEQ